MTQEWGVEYPAGITQVSDDRADAEEWVRWIVDGRLVGRAVIRLGWHEATPDA